MGTILDVILLVVILGFVISGFKIGLVRSLVELVGYVFAVMASVTLASRFTGLVGSLIFHSKTQNILQLAITKVLTTVLLFVLLQMLVRMIAGALDTVFRLPVLHQVNSLLGGVFGLFKGVLVVFLLCAALQLMLPLLIEKYPEFAQNQIGRSCIYQYTYVNNPIYKLYQVEI